FAAHVLDAETAHRPHRRRPWSQRLWGRCGLNRQPRAKVGHPDWRVELVAIREVGAGQLELTRPFRLDGHFVGVHLAWRAQGDLNAVRADDDRDRGGQPELEDNV